MMRETQTLAKISVSNLCGEFSLSLLMCKLLFSSDKILCKYFWNDRREEMRIKMHMLYMW